MSKGITRTIVSQEIEVAKFENGGLVELPKIIVDKEITHEEAVKLVSKTYKGEQAVVTNISEPKQEKRRISLEAFMQYSEVIGTDIKEDENTEYVPTEEEAQAEYQEAL